MFLAPSLLWLSRCLHLCYKAWATANIPPPPLPLSPPSPPSPQLSASDSDPNLSGIPSSWSACWAVLRRLVQLRPSPRLLDYLHPRWCNPVLVCRTPILPSCFIFYLFCPGKRCCECTLFPNDLCSFSHLIHPGLLQLKEIYVPHSQQMVNILSVGIVLFPVFWPLFVDVCLVLDVQNSKYAQFILKWMI